MTAIMGVLLYWINCICVYTQRERKRERSREKEKEKERKIEAVIRPAITDDIFINTVLKI